MKSDSPSGGDKQPTDTVEYRVVRALMALAQAGETDDSHIEREALLESIWRFRSIDINQQSGQ